MTITIVGAGYVGLVTSAVFANFGNKVYCIDINEQRIKDLKNGKIPFFEPGLEELVLENIRKNRLIFTTSYQASIPKSKVVLICVGTPPKDNGETDMSFLFSAVEDTAKHLTGYTVIAIKSTIPVGFEEELESIIKNKNSAQFNFAACPEFLREGTAIADSLNPDRIVIGTKNQKAQKLLLELHAPISGERIITDVRSAQLIKYGANTILAMKISFANAIAQICEKTGADVEKVITGIGADKRIGRAFLYPGIGYGGSCLPKDVLAFIHLASRFGYDFSILQAVDSVNNLAIENFVKKIENALKGLTNKTIAVLGLAFKPNTDDLREAPSLKIIDRLLTGGAKITVYDPQAIGNAKKILKDKNIKFAIDSYNAIEGSDAIVIATEWDEFKQINLEKVKKIVKRQIIFDGRNIFDPEKLKQLGFEYFGVGR